jgi:hypothetical protein
MATFTVDLLTGNIYLFNGDFSGSGGTPTSGSTYPQVNVYSELPLASAYPGQIYVVRQGSGSYVLNRKPSGFYFSTGTVWRFLGDTPDFFKSDNFQIYDSADTTKGVMFVTSGISTTTFRKLTIQNSNGTIAYLSDLATKVNLSAFADYTGTTAPNQFASKVSFNLYTGTTAPNTYLTKVAFNSFTGTTLPTTYLSKSAFNTYSGATLLLIQGKQDTLIAGSGINISGTTISVSLPKTMQLLDTVGGVNVNNIIATAIQWITGTTGTSLSFTGGSRIYIQGNGLYGISYVLNVNNDTGSAKNIGTVIRKNGSEDITPMSSASFNLNVTNDSSTNMMPEYMVSLLNGEYLELMAFRIGTSGAVYTVGNGSWIKIHKILT